MSMDSIGTIRPININEEMRGSFLDYAMSVIVARALPDARDGLKPVHRRILFAMYDMGIRSNSQYKKSARIVGEVLGKYHPHGDVAVYDSMARMAQTFSLRYPLVDGQGNFGSVDGDSPAAMRYTEARLAKLAEELLVDIDMNTVDFVDNYDGTQQEPSVLPARLPNMLLNGASGIAVGMATNIPPHNLRELAAAISYLIDNYELMDEVTVDDLMHFVKAPDFPTGAAVVVEDELKEAYATGRGRCVVRAKAHIEQGRADRQRIVITEIPYQISKVSIIERIVSLVREDRLTAISDLRDESDRQGMRLVIELKAGAQPKKVLNQLYKYTQLQSTYSIQMLALVNGEPKTLSLKRFLQIYIDHRFEVISRRSQFELDKRRGRAHILEGLLKALSSLDAIIQTIRSADDVDTARTNLMTLFGLSEAQSNAILEMQLRRLAALEQMKLQSEFNEVMTRIAYLEDLLATPPKILALIREDLTDLAETFGDDRRTEVVYGVNTQFAESDLVREEEVVVLLSRFGYIKRVPSNAYRAQRRGGKGVMGMTGKDDDGVVQIVSSISLDTLLFFTDKGKVYSEKAYNIPEGQRAGKGTHVQSILALTGDEHITAILPVSSFGEGGAVVMATQLGRIKRVNLGDFAEVRPSGLIAISLEDNDRLISAKTTNGDQHVILVTEDGQSIRFHEDEVRVMGRGAAGVNSIRLVDRDTVVGMDVVGDEHSHIVIITRNGYGKRTAVDEYRIQGRFGLGTRTLSRNEKTGPVVSMCCINPKDDILFITRENIVLRTKLDEIRETGRNTQGVKVMDLAGGDYIIGVAVMDGSVEVPEMSEMSEDGVSLNGDGPYEEAVS
ncbi:DNA gyrase subunit A [Candidatus Flexifilum breve]|uniref:DNA gyrase subunit A n=1 Tax=Candidatus Flexifilum breve TaxID=3140694 RepID=UPI0031CCA5E4